MEHEHHPVTFLHPVFNENICGFNREVSEIPEGIFLLLTVLAYPYHCQFVPVGVRPFVYDIKSEIIELRNINPERFKKLII